MFLYGTIFIFVLWQVLSLCLGELTVPSPISTIRLAFEYLGRGYTYQCLGYSLLRMLAGFGIAFVIAFALGLLVNDSEKLYQFFTPTMTFLKAIPTAAVVFLFVVLTTAQRAPMLVVVLIAIPILYEANIGGFKSTDKYVLESAEVDGANKFKRVLKVQLPMAIPYMVVGMLSAFSLSFKIEIMAEVITGSTENGIGSLIKGAMSSSVDMTPVFAYSFIAVMLMLIITLAVYVITQKIKARQPR